MTRPHTHRVARWTLLPLLALFAVACGGADAPLVTTESTAPFVPVIESTELAVGEPRLVVTLLDRNAPPQFADGTTFAIRYFDPVQGGVRFREEQPLDVIRVGDETFYAAPAPFDRAGRWELQVIATPPGDNPVFGARLAFGVGTLSATPAIGAPAIDSPGDTLADTPIDELSTHPNPEPRLYETSITQALAQQRPFAVVFSTVGFCFGSGVCERAVDQLSALAADAGLLAIHVEPLTGLADPDGPFPSASGVLTDWHLENDPWIFVVDAAGIVRAKFEVVVTDAELRAALNAVAQ